MNKIEGSTNHSGQTAIDFLDKFEQQVYEQAILAGLNPADQSEVSTEILNAFMGARAQRAVDTIQGELITRRDEARNKASQMELGMVAAKRELSLIDMVLDEGSAYSDVSPERRAVISKYNFLASLSDAELKKAMDEEPPFEVTVTLGPDTIGENGPTWVNENADFIDTILYKERRSLARAFNGLAGSGIAFEQLESIGVVSNLVTGNEISNPRGHVTKALRSFRVDDPAIFLEYGISRKGIVSQVGTRSIISLIAVSELQQLQLKEDTKKAAL